MILVKGDFGVGIEVFFMSINFFIIGNVVYYLFGLVWINVNSNIRLKYVFWFLNFVVVLYLYEYVYN